MPHMCTPSVSKVLDVFVLDTLPPEPVLMSQHDAHVLLQETGMQVMDDTASNCSHSACSCFTDCSYDDHSQMSSFSGSNEFR